MKQERITKSRTRTRVSARRTADRLTVDRRSPSGKIVHLN